MNPVIKLTNAGVSFSKHAIQQRSLKYSLSTILDEKEKPRFYALANVSLSIGDGEHVGIIGRNGAGKTTLMRVIARVITPQAGGVYVNTKRHVVPLLELGIGFHGDLSGRENCVLAGILMGYSKREIEQKIPGIIEFSELGDFFDEPVKAYSSGMYARLAFALATDVQPDVLLVDEVFGVGDEFFMRKCVVRMQHLMRSGTTTVFVSHNLDFLVTQCERLVWLDKGRVVMDGSSLDVANAYRTSGGNYD
ncbi:MAG: ABC transporter ATP-binding protein [Phycisphaeraceae bacterium]|nr:ABC transporter ATP-binding protein [Bacteroidota bacterium]MCW5768126.1 ABC transporter ATP-binding protein [Phycisphaeraceae bacterium]